MELLLHHAPWLAYCVSPFCLGRLGRLSLRACRFSFLQFQLAEDRIVLGDIFWQLGPSLFVLRHFFLLGVGLRLDMKWAEIAKFFGPIVSISESVQKPPHFVLLYIPVGERQYQIYRVILAILVKKKLIYIKNLKREREREREREKEVRFFLVMSLTITTTTA